MQCFGGDCYALAFGVPAALMAFSLGNFFSFTLSGTPEVCFFFFLNEQPGCDQGRVEFRTSPAVFAESVGSELI